MIILILILALILRIIKLNQSLWLDEAINVLAVKSNTFVDLITKYSIGDFHPPLYHLILRITVLIFGTSEIIVRMPSVLFGVITVFLIYIIGKELYDKKTGIIAAILIATSPLHIYYSQEARMYSLAAFCASLAVYFFLRVIKTDQLIYWVGFMAASVLMLYSDYLPYFLIPTFMIFLFIHRSKFKILKTFIPSILLIFIFLSPWLYLLPNQLKTGILAAKDSPAWADIVGSPDIKDIPLTFTKFTVGRISYHNDFIYALVFSPVAVFVALMFAASLFRISPRRSFVYFWLLFPLLLSFVVGFFIPIFSYFRYIFLLPAFYLIIAAGINTIKWAKWNRITLFIILIVNSASIFIYFSNRNFQREDWRAATGYVQQNAKENSIVLFESADPFTPFDYYNQGKVPSSGALSGFAAEKNYVENKIIEITGGKNKVFLFQYLQGLTDPNGLVFESLSKNSFKNTKTVNFPGVGFIYEFEK